VKDRHTTRPVLVIAGLLILALLTGLLAWRAAARHRMERQRDRFSATVRSLGLDLGHRPGVPAVDNAARWLRAATSLVNDTCIKASINPLAGKPAATWTPAQREGVVQCIESNREVLDLLHRAARCPGSDWELSLSLDAKVPPSLNLLQCSRLLGASATIHMDRGEVPEAMEDLAAMGTVARSLEEEKLLICTLVGVASENNLLSVLRHAVASGRIGPAQVAAAESLLPRTDLVKASRQAFGVETNALIGAVNDSPNDRLFQPETKAGFLLLRFGPILGIPVRETLVADIYELGTRRLRLAETPYARLAAAPPAAAVVHFPANIVVPRRMFGNGLVWSFLGRIQETTAWRYLARVSLALIRQAGENGRYPDTLPVSLSRRQLFSDSSPRLELHADGSARLFLPKALELSDRLWKWTGKTAFHHLAWELPPPAGRK